MLRRISGDELSRWRVGFVAVSLLCMGILRGEDVAVAGDGKTLAQQILEATDVKGGFVVHAGCGDGELVAALGANSSYSVHGFDADEDNVDKARERIRALGLYGRVSVERWAKKRLPYTDNLVNLLVSKNLGQVSMDEVLRVLAPKGIAYIKSDDKWTKTVKPRPREIDEWTHYLHDASGNSVAHDSVVGPPRHLQWVGSPKWARHHDHMASMSALVSTGGRIFYIFDEGSHASIQLPPKWFLIARDAFNGTVLWKRPIPTWHTHIWPLKSGPAYLTRRLVAEGNRVYAPLGLEAPLVALDAATGETVRTYEGSKALEEVITLKGVLFLLVNPSPAKREKYRPVQSFCWAEMSRANRYGSWNQQKRSVMAVEAETGNVLWQKKYAVAPMTLTADGELVFFHDGQKVVCLDRKNGEEKWISSPVERRKTIPSSFGPRLVVHQDVVVFAGGSRSMSALSVETGETLWTAEHPRSGHASPEDLFIIDGLVWSGSIAGGNHPGIFKGRDLHTGEVKSEFPPDVKTYWFHHRCYPSKATDRFILSSRSGIEFIDFRTKHWTPHHWVRGGCIYGVMPCNGLIYAPAHACACYLEAKLYGFCALASNVQGRGSKVQAHESDGPRLERGPVYDEIQNSQSRIRNPNDWPTYRHDPARSGFTATPVPTELQRSWQTDLGGKLSSVVVADGKLFVASVDTHTLHALNVNDGEKQWSYTAGGRIDSPPTIYQGRALFGSADGWVYCLRASDGELAWRFRAAPADRRLTAFEQLESVWPVHGSVLVLNDVLYCVAGRSMFLDGGLHLLKLDPKTGSKISEVVLDDRDPESGKNLHMYVSGLNMPAALPDVLSSDGRYVYMRSQRFDLDGARQQIAPREPTEQQGEGLHLFSPIGFLDGTMFHRAYWMYGKSFGQGWPSWPRAGRYVPSGRPLVFDDTCVYGFGRKPEYFSQSSVLEYQLFAADKQIKEKAIEHVNNVARRMNTSTKNKQASVTDWRLRKRSPVADLSAVGFKWSHDQPPFQARAMALADRVLFVAGPPDVVDEEDAFDRPYEADMLAKLNEQDAALEGQKGALLWVVAAADGKKLSQCTLPSPPVWDGMIAANKRLYLSTQAGSVLCLAGSSD